MMPFCLDGIWVDVLVLFLCIASCFPWLRVLCFFLLVDISVGFAVLGWVLSAPMFFERAWSVSLLGWLLVNIF